MRGRLHVQQIVQHERLSAGLRGRWSRDHRAIGDAVEYDLIVRAAADTVGRTAATLHDGEERDRNMQRFAEQVQTLAQGLASIPEVRCQPPDGTFYVFPDVKAVCNRLGLTSHGLAMFLLEAADDQTGLACLGGECFGAAGAGFLRFSCAETPDVMSRPSRSFARPSRDTIAPSNSCKNPAFRAAAAVFRLRVTAPWSGRNFACLAESSALFPCARSMARMPDADISRDASSSARHGIVSIVN